MPATPLADGGHSISAIVINKAGVSSVPSAAFGFTVDTTPPKAPTKLVATATGVDVYFDTTDAKAGDKVRVIFGDGPVDHVLTAADIAAGKAYVANPVPPFTVGFEGMPIAPEGTYVPSLESGRLTITGSQMYVSPKTSVSEMFWGMSGNYLAFGMPAGAGPTLQFAVAEGTDFIGFRWRGTDQSSPTTMTIYDMKGGVIDVVAIPGGATPNDYNFAAPVGREIGRVTFETKDGRDVVAAMDNLQIGGGPTANLDASAVIIDPVGNVSAQTMPDVSGTFALDGDETGDRAGADADAAAHGTDVLDHPTQGYTEADDQIIARLGFADRLEGGAGNDTFLKVGTGDVVHGGAGNDRVHVNSGDFERIDGGLGVDTLVMDGKAMHIDLSALGPKVQGVEKFDLGAGGNTLALSTHDVLAGGARDMVVADGKVQMLVNGANGEVDLLGGTHGDDGWTQGGNATVGGVTYGVYTNLAGTAELLVEDKVHVTIL
ncbi:hypothetical protein D9M72_254660 [compost metagenome]